MIRIVETAHCCGAVHRRWRPKSSHSGFVRHVLKANCSICGVKLAFAHRPTTQAGERARYQRRAGLASLYGLTRHGLARHRLRLTPLERRARSLARWHARAHARLAAGLTTRGTAPRQRRWRELDGLHGPARNRARDRLRYRQHVSHLMPSANEMAWQALRGTIVAIIPDLLPTLDREWLERNTR